MEPANTPPRKAKASIAQVAATIFFGLLAIGKENTWKKDGATVTPVQVIVGALIGLIIVIAGLITLVLFVTQ